MTMLEDGWYHNAIRGFLCLAPQNSLLRFRGELVAQVIVQSSLAHMILGDQHLVLHIDCDRDQWSSLFDCESWEEMGTGQLTLIGGVPYVPSHILYRASRNSTCLD